MKTVFSILRQVGVLYVSFILLLFGVSKLLGLQFQISEHVQYMPLKDLPLFYQAWAFFARSYPYNAFLGVSEILAAILIVFRKTRLLGLLMAVGLYINIIIINIEFHIPALFHAIVEFTIVLLLLIPYLHDLKFFFWDSSGKINGISGSRLSRWSLALNSLFIIAVLTATSILLTRTNDEAHNKKMEGSYTISEFTLNDTTQNLQAGKYTLNPMIFFEWSNSCLISANRENVYGEYAIEDSTGEIKITLEQEFCGVKSLRGKLNENGEIDLNEEAGTKEIAMKLKREPERKW